jgi:hypothetical protein
MTGAELIKRAGELTRHARPAPPSRWDRLAGTMHRAAAEIEHRRHSVQRRGRVRQLAVAGALVGVGAAVVLARLGTNASS